MAAAAVAFYRDGLGWATEGIVGTEFEHGAVAFFPLQTGLQLALWNRTDLAHDAGIPRAARSSTEFSLGYNVNSAAEVDAAAEDDEDGEEGEGDELSAEGGDSHELVAAPRDSGD